MKMDGVKFRRQQPIDDYIVDFVSFENRLVIEVDGGLHDHPANRFSDERRMAHLRESGFQVIRFWDNEVLTNTEGVAIRIGQVLKSSIPSPASVPDASSPVKGEEGDRNLSPPPSGEGA